MAKSIQQSVGRGGLNKAPDIAVVQELFNKVPLQKGGPKSPLTVDGKTGTTNWAKTVDQISLFQYACFKWQDGKIDPGGKTWNKLVAYDSAGGAAPVTPSPATGAGLSGSVGAKGTNKLADVKRVQELLNQVPRSAGGPRSPLPTTGVASGSGFSVTLYAILEFQQRSLGFQDGRIDPGGKTWNKLVAYDRRVASATPPAPPAPPPAPKLVVAAPTTDDGKVQAEIDEAYRETKSYGGTTQVSKNEFAWGYCLQKRKRTSIQNTILAAAEHYLYARYEASSGVLGGARIALGVGLYDLFKALPGTSHAYNWWLKTQGEAPASKPTILSTWWGAKGVGDGTADYTRSEF